MSQMVQNVCPSQSDVNLLNGIRRISLEVTAGCNEHCVHCCVSASPDKFSSDKLTRSDFERLLSEANGLGCKYAQFIGGEPATKRADLMHLVRFAHDLGYGVEVFSNLTLLTQPMLDLFKECRVSVGTSFYSSDEKTHESITRLRGSYRFTSGNISRVVQAGLPLRVGLIVMDENKDQVEPTLTYLANLGVRNIGVEHVRLVGRAGSSDNSIDELCHGCWKGNLLIASDGIVYPCTIGRDFPIGSVLESSLGNVLAGKPLSDFRKLSYVKYNERQSNFVACFPTECSPADPPECMPECNPSTRPWPK